MAIFTYNYKIKYSDVDRNNKLTLKSLVDTLQEAAIGHSEIAGYGVNNIPIYYPEGQTDFIFTSFASCFGLIGMIILIILIIIFNMNLINKAINTNTKTHKIIIISFVSVLIYQQIQNIAMTIGLLPITGITLPFISYGGSSLISFMILLGIIFSLENKKNDKTVLKPSYHHFYYFWTTHISPGKPLPDATVLALSEITGCTEMPKLTPE